MAIPASAGIGSSRDLPRAWVSDRQICVEKAESLCRSCPV
jgi:hypothetical protein